VPEVPSQIGKYTVISRLGSGGMGTVYLGRDLELDRPVAIKVLRDEIRDDEALERFFREARAAAALRHPNIITIYNTGQHDHQPFIAMEFVDGVPLTEIIRHGSPLTLSDKLSYIDQICAGLHFAHRAGIVHRDIKPANLMADREGVIRILDFGIARVEGSGMTRDGMMMGTLNYMSPEQMLGRPVDHRSDIFAVGAVAYEILCYQQAFRGSLNDGLLHRLPNEDPPPLTELCAGLPDDLERVVMRALQKTPDKRFADLGEMRAALVEARRHLEVAASQETIVVRPGSSPRTPSSRTAPTSTSTATRDALGLLNQPRESKDLSVRQCVADAHLQLEKGNSVGAVRLLQHAVAIDPNNRAATELLSRVQSVTSQTAGAGTAAVGVGAAHTEADAAMPRGRSTRTTLVLAGVAIVVVLAVAAVPWFNRGGGPATSPTGEGLSSANVTTPEGARAIPAGPASAAPEGASRPQTGGAPTAGPPASSIAGTAVTSKATTPSSAVTQTTPVNGPSDLKPAVTPAALSNAPTGTSPAAPAAANTVAPDSGIPDLLARVRTMYTSGDLAGALDLLAQNPGASNDSAVKDVSARIASAAFESMSSSEKDARARNAPDLAGEALRVANDAKSRAESARQRSALVDAGIQALLARDAYQQAAVQALAKRTEPAAGPAAAAIAPPKDALESERAGIVAALGRFQAAYRDRDMNALLQVFPSLQREARQALERAFRDCRAYDVGFGEMEFLLNPSDATAAQVTVPTTYSCTVRTGQRPQVASQRDVFVLRKRAGTWIIERTGSVN